MYDLDREGAFTANSPASEASSASPSTSPPSNSGPAGSGGGDGDFLDDGWGVIAVGGSTSPAAAAAGKSVARREKKRKQQLQAATALAAAAAAAAAARPASGRAGAAAQRPVATPFFEKGSEAGVIGLSLLQVRLLEEGTAVDASHGAVPVDSRGSIKADVSARAAPCCAVSHAAGFISRVAVGMSGLHTG